MEKYVNIILSLILVDVLGDVSYCIPENTIDCVQLNLKIDNEIINGQSRKTNHKINIHKTDLKVLLNELKTVKQIMENYDFEKKYNN